MSSTQSPMSSVSASGRVICWDTTPVKMQNVFPEGAQGLKASRWASPAKSAPARPAQPSSPKPAAAVVAAASPKPSSTSTGRVICYDTTPVGMENPFPEGAKGLSASRWASPSPFPSSPSSAPSQPKPQPSTDRRVICDESTPIGMENPFPEGAKGLSASRFASPASPISKPAQSQPQPKPGKPQPIATSNSRVICYDNTPVGMENPFPEGAKGLSASRFASPAEPISPKPAQSQPRPQANHQKPQWKPLPTGDSPLIQAFAPGTTTPFPSPPTRGSRTRKEYMDFLFRSPRTSSSSSSSEV